MESRHCKKDVDSFCFICGELIKVRSTKFPLATNLNFEKPIDSKKVKNRHLISRVLTAKILMESDKRHSKCFFARTLFPDN